MQFPPQTDVNKWISNECSECMIPGDSLPVNTINTGKIPRGNSSSLGEAKMAATNINVVHNFSTIFSFSKTVRKLGYRFINHYINS